MTVSELKRLLAGMDDEDIILVRRDNEPIRMRPATGREIVVCKSGYDYFAASLANGYGLRVESGPVSAVVFD